MEQQTEKLCFLLSCDKKYSQFIVPFVHFSSMYNKPCFYEFFLSEDINEEDIKKIAKLSELLNVDIKLIRYEENIRPEKMRFLKEPISQAYDYAYIGDIDIFVFEKIINDFHKYYLKDVTKVYDNPVRPNKIQKRLSGLHFCNKEYFDITRNVRESFINDLKLHKTLIDEQMLYKICEDSGLPFDDSCTTDVEFNRRRPIHGIHVSLNRKPFKEDSPLWMSLGKERFTNKFLKCIETDFFKDSIVPLFNESFLSTFNVIVDFVKSKKL